MNCDENRREAEVKYINMNRSMEKVKYEKTMQYINDMQIYVSDMAAVEDINEVDLLNNVKNRFNKKNIFTNVGPTLIILNPYQKIEGVFSEEIIDKWITYHNKNQHEERKQIDDPHLYDLTLIAIKNLNTYKKNQAIVISGESGAGKTETAKNAMKCITYYFAKEALAHGHVRKSLINPGGAKSLENQILGCNPILEAFGNAKTVRNDNSSRFGKYVTINLDMSTGKIEGAQIQTYLLEKSRVCEPSEGERNYHIFYHLLIGGDTELLKELCLERDPFKYNYLSVSKCSSVNTINDEILWQETIDAFHITGFSENEIKTILKIIAVCLHLGNLKFKEENNESKIDNQNLFEIICILLDCDKEKLETALIKNTRTIQGQIIATPLKINDAINFRNVFAKELYNRVFNFIVKKLNYLLSPNINKDDPNKKYIGLLDIFGFECFQFNSLEQFCINFTNEKLQQLYINDFFKSEQNEFIKEGLKDSLGEISFKDNQPIIDLMDKSGSGIFQLLDDMCITNNDDKNFYNAVTNKHMASSSFKYSKISQNKFSIIHTAKDVEYTVNGFVIKNVDEVKQTMIDALLNSKNTQIKYITMNVLNEQEYEKQTKIMEEESKMNKKKDSKYLGGKFRNEMLRLMAELSSCSCHYVRCLKPNELKRKEFFVPTFVFQQIRYLGILDTIRIRKEGFPCRKKFKDFFARFEEICWYEKKKPFYELKHITDDFFFKELSIKCLDYMTPKRDKSECLIGSNKIFMKQQFYTKLENLLLEKIKKKEESQLIISKFYFGQKKRNKFLYIKNKAKYLQIFYRNKKYYIKTQKMRSAAKKIQSTFRALLMNRTYKYMLVCIYKIQNVIKGILVRKKYKKMKRAGAFLNKKFHKCLIKFRNLKKKRIRNIVYDIYERAWNFILRKYKFFAAIKCQAHIRSLLAKKNNWSKVVIGRTKRKMFLEYKYGLLIQKNYKGFKVRLALKIANGAAFKIQGFWKMSKFSILINEMRNRCKKIQRNVRVYLIRKHVIEKRLNEFYREENGDITKLIFENSKIMFPNFIHINEAEVNEFFDDYSSSGSNIEQTQKAALPFFDPYGEPKINIFAKILDIDTIVYYFFILD